MVWLWSAVAVIILAAIVTLITLKRPQWTLIQTETGIRVDLIDRLYAYLKAEGIRTKVTGEGALRQLHVQKKDEVRARELARKFYAEL
ncbi:hypothetical protein [Paenibacillus xylaniclasticus]|uniref:hypothetical protein n=1 Tax=Paenibacillus xylaniclasticus TaxID=588083 RepID=UPI000FD9781C|nr:MULTISPECIES: hypothetical protein [Paenibacillus]GFN32750.1 hypothetical protein PCURB6_30100 [Paenibacillus curdlanolyticus]